MDGTMEFVNYILEEIKEVSDVNVEIFDTEKTLNAKGNLRSEVDKFIANILLNRPKEHTICFINGVDKFISDIQNENEFYNMLQQAESAGNYSFVLIDKTSRLKNREYDNWYKHYIEGDTAIYVGSGIDDQYLVALNDRRGLINNCGRSFGYVIKHGKPTLIKLVGMKEAGDEDE